MTTLPSVQDIKTLTARGWLLSEIAERFGITKAHVVAILEGKAYCEVDARMVERLRYLYYELALPIMEICRRTGLSEHMVRKHTPGVGVPKRTAKHTPGVNVYGRGKVEVSKPKHAFMLDRSTSHTSALPFTAQEVRFIRKAFSRGVSAQDIAAEFGTGVNATTVRFVATTSTVYSQQDDSKQEKSA